MALYSPPAEIQMTKDKNKVRGGGLEKKVVRFRGCLLDRDMFNARYRALHPKIAHHPPRIVHHPSKFARHPPQVARAPSSISILSPPFFHFPSECASS